MWRAGTACCPEHQGCPDTEGWHLGGRLQALAALFMMNNLHYMVKTVESSEALTVLGEEWIELHKDQVRLHSRHDWSRVEGGSSV